MPTCKYECRSVDSSLQAFIIASICADTAGSSWVYPDKYNTLSSGGKTEFGFTARYKNDVSPGKLNFQYKDFGFHLKSTSIDWLAISSVGAQFRGTGTKWQELVHLWGEGNGQRHDWCG